MGVHLAQGGLDEHAVADALGKLRFFEESAALGGGASQATDEAAPTEVASEDETGLPGVAVGPEWELGAFVVSISSKRRVRRLHQVGSCWMTPGVDYKDFQVLGQGAPSAEQFDQFCKLCWRDGGPVLGAAAVGSAGPAPGAGSESGGSGETASSSSGSGEVEEAAAPRVGRPV